MSRAFSFFIIFISLSFGGCTAHYPVNEPITSIDESAGYRLGKQQDIGVQAYVSRYAEVAKTVKPTLNLVRDYCNPGGFGLRT